MAEDVNPNMHHVTLHKAKKAWYKRFWVWVGIIVALSVLGAAVNGAGNNTTVTTTSANATTTTTNSKTASNKSAATTAKVGDTLNIGGSKGLAVTLQQVIDPAQGSDQFTTPDAGKRFVATLVKIVNNGGSAYNDDANSNLTLIGSDNQSYTADFDSVSECTNFNNGSYTLAAGESATGCVVFQVPNSVSVAKIQFQTTSGFSDNTGEWTVH